MVALYEGGITISELAERFDVDTATTSKHLKQRGVVVRRYKLTEAQVQEVERLYSEGLSLREIGRRVGIHRHMVRRVLTRSGRGTRLRSLAS